ncbi:MAG: PAS domain S-box protein [Syntrophotaleaceae bacterium]
MEKTQRFLAIDCGEKDLEGLKKLLRENGYSVSEKSIAGMDRCIGSVDMTDRWHCGQSPLEKAFRESEERFRKIVETAEEGIWQVDREWKTTYVNQRMEQMLGCDPGGMLDRHLMDFLDEEGREAIVEFMARRENGIRETHDFRFVRSDGARLDALVCASPLLDAQGEFAGSFAMVTDITERKRAEEDLKLSRFIIDRASLGIFRGSRDGRILYVNEYGANSLGYTQEELCCMTFFDIDPNLTPDWWREHRQKLIDSGSRTFDSIHRRKDGTIFPVEVTVNYLEYEGTVYSCSFSRDITERKKAEEDLRASELKYRSIVENAPFGITHSTKEGKLTRVNPALAAILKYDSAEELMETINRSSIQDVLFPDRSERDPLVGNIFSTGSWYVFNNRLKCKDGSIVTCRVHSRPVVDKTGQANEFESYQENITDQLKAEQALRESEEKFRVLAETSPVAICLYQLDRIIYANPAMERLFGYSVDEFYRMTIWDWAHEDFRELIRMRKVSRLKGEAVPDQYEARYMTKTGIERYVLISAGVIEYQGRPTVVASFLDISERKRSEQLLQASLREKDVLLREIHHRVKNNLQVVSSLLFLQAQKIRDPELAGYFTESQNRISSMALAHEQLYQSKNLAEVRLPDYIESLVEEIEKVFRPKTEVRCMVDIEDIELDIEQVVPCGLLITELLTNALRHAFPGSMAGTVRVEMKRENDFLILAVTDDGVGLPPDFDVSSCGTFGFQLIMALTKQLDGALHVERDKGTRFRVTFRLRNRQ